MNHRPQRYVTSSLVIAGLSFSLSFARDCLAQNRVIRVAVPGVPNLRAWDLTSTPLTVVGDNTVFGAYRPWRWSQPDGAWLGPQGFRALRVSSDGLVSAGNTSAGGYVQAFGQAAEVVLPVVGGYARTQSLSADGNSGLFDIYRTSAPLETLLWSRSEGLTPLPPPPGYNEFAGIWASDANDEVLGNAYFNSGSPRAFRWSPASGWTLVFPQISSTTITGVSRNGHSIAAQGVSAFNSESFVWSEESGMQVVTPPDDYESVRLWSVSNDGAVGVGMATTYELMTDVIWVRGHGTFLPQEWLAHEGISGFTLGSLSAISPDGQWVAGNGYDGPERFIALIRVLPPCPADFNLNGTADFFDYLDFADAFSRNDSNADFNHDGTVDMFDYLDFVVAFDAGCP